MGNQSNGGNLDLKTSSGVPQTRWRSNMDAAEYKHVVLGLIFLKYISDAFEEEHAKLEADRATLFASAGEKGEGSAFGAKVLGANQTGQGERCTSGVDLGGLKSSV